MTGLATALVLLAATLFSCCFCSAAATAHNQTAHGSNATLGFYGGFYWVEALPPKPSIAFANDTGLWHTESHVAACSRVGLASTEHSVILGKYGWNATALASVAASMKAQVAPNDGLRGCCVGSMWCEGSHSSLKGGSPTCHTHSFGSDVYHNHGWFADNSIRPVFTCKNRSMVVTSNVTTVNNVTTTTNTTGFSELPVVTKVSPTTGDAHSTITLTGHNMGNEPTDLDIQIGGIPCTDINVCHNMCKSCTSNNQCASNQLCVAFRTTTRIESYCVVPCAQDTLRCGCGAQCHSFSTSSPRLTHLCLNSKPSSICKPLDIPSNTSVVECTIGSGCVVDGAAPPIVSLKGEAALPTNTTPSFSLSSSECLKAADCDRGNLCETASCNEGCCMYNKTAECSTQLRRFVQRKPLSGLMYQPLPQAVTVALGSVDKPLVQPFVGNLSTDQFSSVSNVDDQPTQWVDLKFPFPFYSGVYNRLALSPNGFLYVPGAAVCTHAFIQLDCDMASSYHGIVGPLLTDFNPQSSSDSKIMIRSSTTQFCVSWRRVMLFSADAIDGDKPTEYTFTVCVYPDGGIHWQYEDAAHVPIDTVFASGVRSPNVPTGIVSPSIGIKVVNGAANMDEERKDAADMEVLFDEETVKTGNAVALCAMPSTSCMSPRCGSAGTQVTLAWGGIHCGNHSVLNPKLFCRFGAIDVPATVKNDTLLCKVPIQPASLGASITVPVFVVLSQVTATGKEWTSVLPVMGYTPRNFTGIAYPRGNIFNEARNEQVISHQLMYTYSTTATCGCNLQPGSVCDKCGLCSGDGSAHIDCAGECFGTAAIDSCGECTGGGTGRMIDDKKDCKGVCFGSADCDTLVTPTPVPGTSTTTTSPPFVEIILLSLIVAVLLGTCIALLVCVQQLRRGRQPMPFPGMTFAPQEPPGLDADELARLPLITYDAGVKIPGGATCAVCIAEFEEEEEIRRLPCQHHFHPECIDQWFVRSRACPLCKADVRDGLAQGLDQVAQQGPHNNVELIDGAALAAQHEEARERAEEREAGVGVGAGSGAGEEVVTPRHESMSLPSQHSYRITTPPGTVECNLDAERERDGGGDAEGGAPAFVASATPLTTHAEIIAGHEGDEEEKEEAHREQQHDDVVAAIVAAAGNNVAADAQDTDLNDHASDALVAPSGAGTTQPTNMDTVL